jgi:pimeloyl-ACP methyl ester carboxylesterase
MAGSSDTSSALGMLLQKTGPAVVIVHSAAGRAGFNVARAHSELVKALIVVEPVGAVTDPAEIRLRFADTPYLAVFGDHFESRRMQGRFDGCREMARLLTEAGGRAEVMRLPELGIHGNTHLLMQDNNSHDIAGKIIRWINGAVED